MMLFLYEITKSHWRRLASLNKKECKDKKLTRKPTAKPVP